MPNHAVPRPFENFKKLYLTKDRIGKMDSGSRYFFDSKHGVTVVVEIEYTKRFLVYLVYGENGKKTKQQCFKRKWFEEKLTQTKEGVIEIIIQNVVGQIRVPCLKKFLEEYPVRP